MSNCFYIPIDEKFLFFHPFTETGYSILTNEAVNENANLNISTNNELYDSELQQGNNIDDVNLSSTLSISDLEGSFSYSLEQAVTPNIQSNLYDLSSHFNYKYDILDPSMHICPECPARRIFTSKNTLRKHIQHCHRLKPQCPYCDQKIRADNMSRHIRRYCSKTPLESIAEDDKGRQYLIKGLEYSQQPNLKIHEDNFIV